MSLSLSLPMPSPLRARVNQVELAYTISGAGPWLTLSHSLAANSTMWGPQLAALSAHFTVLCIDTRGHGGSEPAPAPYHLEQLADDVLALWDHLGVDQSHFMGISLGGMIGQVLALKAPQRVRSLVLADTTGRGAPNAAAMWAERSAHARANGMQALVEGTIARWFTEPFRQANPALMAEVAAMIAATTIEGYCGACAAIAGLDTLDALASLTVPALIIVGAQDQGTPPAMSQALHAQLRGSHLLVLEDAAHIANIEQAERFNRAAIEFLLAIH